MRVPIFLPRRSTKQLQGLGECDRACHADYLSLGRNFTRRYVGCPVQQSVDVRLHTPYIMDAAKPMGLPQCIIVVLCVDGPAISFCHIYKLSDFDG